MNANSISMDVVRRILYILNGNVEIIPSLTDSISEGQMQSKQWLVDHLEGIDLGSVYLCGGWYGMLMLSAEKLRFERVLSIDNDPSCQHIAETIHRKYVKDNWRFRAQTRDIHDLNYQADIFTFFRADGTSIDLSYNANTIVNTSCEHIENFGKWWENIPAGMLVALQSNNGFGIEGHVNCSKSLQAFDKTTPMSKVLYKGEKQMPKFTRFMKIGYK